MNSNSIEIFQVSENSYSFYPVQDQDQVVVNSSYGNTATTHVSSFIDYISTLNYSNVNSGLMPPGVKLIIPGFIIFERPPTMKLVQYINHTVDQIVEYENYSDDEYSEDEDGNPIEISKNDLKVNSHYIPIPWQLYMVSYSTNPSSMYHVTSVNMFFMNGPLVSDDTILYAPYLFNFYNNGLLCSPMFSDYEEVNRYSKDISGTIAAAYDWVWNTGFNRDLTDCISFTCSKVKNKVVRQAVLNMRTDQDFDSFFKTLSNYTPDQIVDLEWLNPTFAVWQNVLEVNYILENRRDIFLNYLEDNKIEIDEEDIDDSDYTEQFYEWYSHQNNSKKTYQDIILKMFFHSPVSWHQDYRDLLDRSTNVDIFNNYYSYTLSSD